MLVTHVSGVAATGFTNDKTVISQTYQILVLSPFQRKTGPL
jgi:hypothetical protein